MNTDESKIITHDFPVWREKSNFIIGAAIEDADVSTLVTSEQIWARQIEDNLFEICCIPFFIYGLALGDRVTTSSKADRKYVIDRVIEKSSHTTYRVWFIEDKDWDEITLDILGLGCLVEKRWDRSKLIGISAPSKEIAAELEAYLLKLESDGMIKCENAS